jgi:formylglycine-generating enzyme required for sulfatase activity
LRRKPSIIRAFHSQSGGSHVVYEGHTLDATAMGIFPVLTTAPANYDVSRVRKIRETRGKIAVRMGDDHGARVVGREQKFGWGALRVAVRGMLGAALAIIPAPHAPVSGADVGVVTATVPFSDCPANEGCPLMVTIHPPAAGIIVGSPASETKRQADEQQHRVKLRDYAIGVHELTVGQYLACVTAGGCRPPEWRERDSPHNIETGTSRYYKNLGAALTDPTHPIVGVSFDDAAAYVAWLSKKTGKTYRLPSEAEWEVAARGGAETAYWWGDEAIGSPPRANCRGCGSVWDAKSPAPTGSFAANPFGLHDMHGNVWEWVADIYCADYASGPVDGSARLSDDCPIEGPRGLRVFRGGSAFFDEHMMRAAVRLRNRADFRNFSIGFRVARDGSR